MPLTPAAVLSHASATLFPVGQTMPIPVITTLVLFNLSSDETGTDCRLKSQIERADLYFRRNGARLARTRVYVAVALYAYNNTASRIAFLYLLYVRAYNLSSSMVVRALRRLVALYH